MFNDHSHYNQWKTILSLSLCHQVTPESLLPFVMLHTSILSISTFWDGMYTIWFIMDNMLHVWHNVGKDFFRISMKSYYFSEVIILFWSESYSFS